MMQNISLDRVNFRDFKTGPYFAVTSPRPIKATLKGLKIATFALQNFPEERDIKYDVFFNVKKLLLMIFYSISSFWPYYKVQKLKLVHTQQNLKMLKKPFFKYKGKFWFQVLDHHDFLTLWGPCKKKKQTRYLLPLYMKTQDINPQNSINENMTPVPQIL